MFSMSTYKAINLEHATSAWSPWLGQNMLELASVINGYDIFIVSDV